MEGVSAIKNHGTCNLIFITLIRENEQIKLNLKQLVDFIIN